MISRNASKMDCKELRVQFSEQSKCLDAKLDTDSMVLVELQEFYRRRSIVEQDYSDALAKLVNNLNHKHQNELGRRQPWTSYTTSSLWNTLLGSTLRLSEAHATLSDVFGKQMTQRLADLDEDCIRLHRQCREMMHLCQEKVLANTAKLLSDQREYGQRQNSSLEADRIKKRFEDKLAMAVQHAQAKKKEPENSQRYRRARAEFDQKNQAYENSVVATNRARNEYLIQLNAANQSIQRYFADEVSDIIDCMNCGFHNSLARAAMMHLSCEEAIKKRHESVGEMINLNVTAFDWRQDKALFLRRNEASFSRPGAFTFIPFKDDNECEISPVAPLRDNLAATAHDLKVNLENLKLSTEETWTGLQEIEKKLLLLINQNDYDVSELFATKRQPRPRSGSLSNGLAPSPTELATSGFSLSSSSIPVGMNKVGVSGSGSVAGSLLSSTTSGGNLNSQPLAVSGQTLSAAGSQASMGSGPQSVGSGQPTEIQPGLYLSLRSAHRESRIREEKVYMERFSAYTQEMHRYYVMQAKLIEIEKALLKSSTCPSGTFGSSVACSPQVHHFPTLSVPTVHLFRDTQNATTPYHSSNSQFSVLQSTSPATSVFTPSDVLPVTYSPVDGDRSFAPLLRSPPRSPLDQTAPSNVITSPVISSNIPLTSAAAATPTVLGKSAPRRVLRVPNIGHPKLFGGSIDEYVEATKEAIPRIVLSCIRVLNLYGMHHQGVFRVSGSQSDIATFRVAFEHGEDPLSTLFDARDVNSTAGLLKLYFRELGEPPFPNDVFMHLITAVRERRESDDVVQKLHDIVLNGLSQATFVVMRYLFAFLNHLSEYSDENMMDPYNLAICFGPTLMPVPPDLDQVEYHASVNEVVKNFIVHHSDIFDTSVAGPRYEKYAYAPQISPAVIARLAVQEQQNRRQIADLSLAMPTDLSRGRPTVKQKHMLSAPIQEGDESTAETPLSESFTDGSTYLNSSNDHLSLDDDTVGDENQSDSESEDSESHFSVAVALADFVGNSNRELTFRRGDKILLYRQLSRHWWEGQLATDDQRTHRLVPTLYISVKGPPLLNASYKEPTPTSPSIKAKIVRTAPLAKDGRPTQTGENNGTFTVDGFDGSFTCLSSANETETRSLKFANLRSHQANNNNETAYASEAEDELERAMPPIMSASVTVPLRVTCSDPDHIPTPPIRPPRKFAPLTDRLPISLEGFATLPLSDTTSAAPTSLEKLVESQEGTKYGDELKANSSQSASSTASMLTTAGRGSILRTPSASLKTGNICHRCSWAGSTAISPLTSNPSALSVLPEDQTVSAVRASGDGSASVHSDSRECGKSIDVDKIPSIELSLKPFPDMDCALAEVMHGLACLEQDRMNGFTDSMTAQRSRELERKMHMPSANHTPDLVLDLPQSGRLDSSPTRSYGVPDKDSSSTFSSPTSASPLPDEIVCSKMADDLHRRGLPTSAADTFAGEDQGTVRKRVGMQNPLEKKLTPISLHLTRKTIDTIENSKHSISAEHGASPVDKSVREPVTERQTSVVPCDSFGGLENEGNLSPVIPIKRGSIAARVAAFEASTGQPQSRGPPWARKV